MNALPATLSKFLKDWPKFKAWLLERGSEIRPTPNAYEVARFTTPEGVGIVYRNGSNALTSWVGGADTAWAAWKDGIAWTVGDRAKRQGGKRAQRIRALTERDGCACWFCGEALGNDITLEHLVAVAHGGPDHLSNLVLAHQACNQRADHLSVAEKVRLREVMHNEQKELAA
ncbi:HNH endonuclease [Azospirillum sp. TSA2s]|uniref:HNH endonuclease n=1 Tax=Azospirillum sp. TSA2s TaxID=709810 RepID=UPI0010A9E590|nr:HNH endonuclease signature motif containing protein [Azospirillum sp. TSA2s]QCG95017.1 HNH endonuclease [Azospirillum sp. TSA2s]